MAHHFHWRVAGGLPPGVLWLGPGQGVLRWDGIGGEWLVSFGYVVIFVGDFC